MTVHPALLVAAVLLSLFALWYLCATKNEEEQTYNYLPGPTDDSFEPDSYQYDDCDGKKARKYVTVDPGYEQFCSRCSYQFRQKHTVTPGNQRKEFLQRYWSNWTSKPTVFTQ